MDERQTQIREGAGLEENRLNQDLIDFLNKWSGPVLILIAVVILAFWGKRWLDRKRIDHVNEAFLAYSSALSGGNPSPESLRRVAQDYEDVPGLSDMALLTTADLYHRAAWLGLRPGTVLNDDGSPADPNDALQDAEKSDFLSSALDLYRQVQSRAESGERWLLASSAAWGVAAVQASLGDGDAARGSYERAAELAERGGFPAIAAAARTRAGGDFAAAPRLYQAEELPAIRPVDADDFIDSILASPPEGAPTAAPAPDAALPDAPVDEAAGEVPTDDPSPEGAPAEGPADDDADQP